MPFWDALRAGTVVAQRCDGCSRLRNVPKEVCAYCGDAAWTWVPLSGRGAVYTYTTVHRAPTADMQAEAPYVVAHVEMEEGIRMIGRLVGVTSDEVRIGLPVRAGFRPLEESWTILEFETEPHG